MKKIIFKLFDGLDWIVKHKKINIFATWVLYMMIFVSANIKFLSWQTFIIALALVILNLKSYGEGRNDESKFNQKINREFEQELLKKVDKVISKTGFKLRKVEPKKVIN